MCIFFFFKQKTAYEMRISDWSSDVCSSDLLPADRQPPCGIVRAFVTGQPVMVARPAGLENQAPDETGRGRHQPGIRATLGDLAAKTCQNSGREMVPDWQVAAHESQTIRIAKSSVKEIRNRQEA